MVFETIEANRDVIGRGGCRHRRDEAIFLNGGVLGGRDEIDPFQADTDGFLAKLIEREPLLVGPVADGLIEASGGSGEGGFGEFRDGEGGSPGDAGGSSKFSAVHVGIVSEEDARPKGWVWKRFFGLFRPSFVKAM